MKEQGLDSPKLAGATPCGVSPTGPLFPERKLEASER